MRVNVVRPGFVDTGLWAALMSPDQKESYMRELEGKALTRNAGQVEDVAEAYLWLMKDGNATGSVAGSDGGWLLV